MKITFKTNQYFVLNEKVNIPIPDGYHYSNSGLGGNAGWLYIVPKDVSLEEDHFNAKPLSFGVTASKIGDFPFDAEKIDAITQFMIMTGYMNNDAATVVPVICSEHCGFLFQSWTDPSDATFNKINGFLFAGDELYQFHVYANHHKEIAHEPKTIEKLVSVVMSWMKKVYLCGEEPTSLEPRVSAAADSIKVGIHTLVEIENRLHNYIGGALDFKKELIELIVAAGVMLFQANGIESDEMLTKLLSGITDAYSVEELKTIQASKGIKVIGYTAHKLLAQYESGFVVNQLVKCDKILKASIQNGASAFFSELLCAYLEYLCAEAGIEKDRFSKKLLTDLEKLKKTKWDSVSIIFSLDEKLKQELVSLLKMESIAFNAPENATDVSGTGEIVRDENNNPLAAKEKYVVFRGSDGKGRIKLGEYPAGESIVWLLLEKQGDELLLLSEFALDAQPYAGSTNEWYDSTLRKWLNENFYAEAFSEEEQDMILNDTHDIYTVSSGNETVGKPATDKVFLLSAKEVKTYFPKDKDKICKASVYAKKQGAEIESGPNQCHWWLRCPPISMLGLPSWAACVRANAEMQGWGIYSSEIGVRPVIRVNCSDIAFPDDAENSTVLSSAKNISSETEKPNKSKSAGKKKKESDSLDGKCPQKESDNPEMQTSATKASGIKYETLQTKKKAVQKKTEKKTSSEPQYTVKDAVLKKFEGMIEVAELPGGITEIGKKAFANNPYIKTVIVPSGVKRIEDGAFEGCTGLEEIYLEDDVEYIGKKVFSGCTNLQSFRIPGNVTALFDETFKDCISLKYIVIHKNVVFIDTFTFPYNNKIDFYGEYNELIRHQVEQQAKSTSKQMLPNVEKPVCTLTAEQLKKLDFIICGHELMLYLGHDKIVIVPDGVRTIAINAFRGSYKDEENTCEQILLPNSVTSIKRCAFDDQSQLQSLEIPYGVKAINMDIVSGCDNLKYITLPETVNTIDVCAFRFCRSLESVNIPKSVRKIAHNAFDGTENVTIYGEYGSEAYNFAKKHSISFSAGLPAGVPKPRTKDDTRYEDAIIAIKQEAEREKRMAEEREKQLQRDAARKQAEEASRLAEEKRRVEEQKRQFRENTVKIKEFSAEKEALLKVIAENKGLFGQKAKTRREAKARLSEVESEITRLSELLQSSSL